MTGAGGSCFFCSRLEAIFTPEKVDAIRCTNIVSVLMYVSNLDSCYINANRSSQRRGVRLRESEIFQAFRVSQRSGSFFGNMLNRYSLVKNQRHIVAMVWRKRLVTLLPHCTMLFALLFVGSGVAVAQR